MSSPTSQLEDAIFQTVVPQLEAEGFAVFVHPSRDMLPPFLSKFQPDAIAYRGSSKVAIEIMSTPLNDGPRVQSIREVFSDHPDWELRLIYAPPLDTQNVIQPLAKTVIEEHLQRVERSIDDLGPTAALLTAWAAFEAAARRLSPTDFARPQTSARLLEGMASVGYITPDEADLLRQVSRIRNGVAHGRLDIAASREQVGSLITITRAVLELGG